MEQGCSGFQLIVNVVISIAGVLFYLPGKVDVISAINDVNYVVNLINVIVRELKLIWFVKITIDTLFNLRLCIGIRIPDIGLDEVQCSVWSPITMCSVSSYEELCGTLGGV